MLKSGKPKKTWKARNVFPSFLFLSFRFWVLDQNRKVGRRKVGKKFPRFPMFARFPSFRPGHGRVM